MSRLEPWHVQLRRYSDVDIWNSRRPSLRVLEQGRQAAPHVTVRTGCRLSQVGKSCYSLVRRAQDTVSDGGEVARATVCMCFAKPSRGPGWTRQSNVEDRGNLKLHCSLASKSTQADILDAGTPPGSELMTESRVWRGFSRLLGSRTEG